MTFTFEQCFSSDCGHCSACCKDTDKGTKKVPYISPYNDVFSDLHDQELKKAISKTKEVACKQGREDHNNILGKVMGIKKHTIYVPLEKRIEKVKVEIKENELLHQLCMEDFERTYTPTPRLSGSRIRRLPEFAPDGLPDLTPGITDIPYKIPDYKNKETMEKIDQYRDQYWKDMDSLMKKYNITSRNSKGTIPETVVLSEGQFNKIQLPSDLTLVKGSTFKRLYESCYSCDNIKCMDMNSIYCAETRTLDIPMYTHGQTFELCGLCLLGK